MISKIEAVVFDWGNTLMQVFSEFNGPMATWPKVEAVPQIHAGLDALKGSARLLLATNASDSGSAQVRAALERVDLAGYFDVIYTSRELGVCKPDFEFFERIQKDQQLAPQQLVMVGDSYTADILGAHAAGWRTAWYTPAMQPCESLLPLNDVQLMEMSELSQLLAGLPLPGLETILRWLQEQSCSHFLLEHVNKVAAIAYFLACRLRRNGFAVDPILAHRGGLLHDVAKISGKTNDRNSSDHGLDGGRFLEARNQHDLAEISQRHMLFNLEVPERMPLTWEQKVVFFADKLVETGSVVTIEERIAGLQKRYKIPPVDVARNKPALEALQAEICTACGIQPSELVPVITAAMQGH